LPGYKGSDGRFAVFDTLDNGMGAMDALLTSYGRRGLKTVRDVVSRWAPASDNNNVEQYAHYVGNGNPDTAVDLSNPEQRKALAQSMARYENGVPAGGPGQPGAPGQPPQRGGVPPEVAARAKALFNIGSPAAQAAAYQLLSKFVGKQEPIKIGEGDTLIDPTTYKPVASGPGKTQDVRPGGALVQNGKVVYQAPPANAGEKIDEQVRQRAAIAEQRKMDPNDPVTQKFVLTGQMDIKPPKDATQQELVAARDREVRDRGIDPDKDQRWQTYIITGKLPGEDKMPITATDKKAILDADEHVIAHEQVLNTLADLKGMSKKAWGFVGSGAAARVLSPVNQGAQDTAELNTTATSNAISQLKTIFGGNPTEGERKILLDIQGSSAMPDALRQKVYDRAASAVERRLEFAKQRAEEMRGATYFKPGGGVTKTTPRATPPQIGTPEFDALPAGGLYVAPDGSVRTKRGP
jgi:hypothetical protein